MFNSACKGYNGEWKQARKTIWCKLCLCKYAGWKLMQLPGAYS